MGEASVCVSAARASLPCQSHYHATHVSYSCVPAIPMGSCKGHPCTWQCAPTVGIDRGSLLGSPSLYNLGHIVMSSLSLKTGTGSSSTLLYGMELTNRGLPSLLQLKEEPGDEEEKAMQSELQAGGFP